MKVSYNWLKDFLNFPYSPEELDAVLTETGLEVEGIEHIEDVKGGLKGVIVGEVLSCEKHPDADKLKVTTVSIGTNEPLQIVCGAPNVAQGQKVLVATVGTTLYPQPDQAFEIKKAKIRGVASEGMLCAEDELGIGQSHDGILVLDASVPVGTEAAALFELQNDAQLEIGLTPNRADAMGHIGVARDIKAYMHMHLNVSSDLNWPAIAQIETNGNSLPIEIQDQSACKAYYGIKLNEIKVEASPAWLQRRLKAVGIKPINNVVDCSNYVMRELGTPLHIFDAQQIKGNVCVRSAKKDESFVALDDQSYNLKGSELVIADQNGPLCLAGIIGGKYSGVNENTSEILIESALFDAVNIRKAARQHGFNTDASFRFERGVDPELTLYALKRCVYLLQQISQAQVSSNIFAFEGHISPAIELELSIEDVNRLIGTTLDSSIIERILIDLDFKIQNKQAGILKIQVPRYRIDVTRPIDVIEEILRIYGLNQVPLPDKWNFSLPVRPKFYAEKYKESTAEFLVGRGFSEILNNSLSKLSYAEKFPVASQNKAIEILNPLSQDLGMLRQTLLFGLLECLQHNQNRQQSNLRVFEFGHHYNESEGKRNEKMQLAMAIIGQHSPENWQHPDPKTMLFNFFHIKAEVLALFKRLGLDAQIQEQSFEDPHFEDGISFDLNGKTLATLGWVNHNIQSAFDLKQKPYIALLNWDDIMHAIRKKQITFQELPKSFAVRRDLSLLITKETSYHELKKAAFNAERKLLQEVQLFDVYEGKNIDPELKSYALSFYLQDNSQTLTDKHIEKAMQLITQALEKACGAKIRM
ncbi:MAG: phenylalanine--tRNA ligase subunit beta [Flavobacteriales bacterium]